MIVCEIDFIKHQFDDDYYGIRCVNCGLFIPYGCEPWAPIDDVDDDDDDDDEHYDWPEYPGDLDDDDDDDEWSIDPETDGD